jgi:hypothetical protein
MSRTANITSHRIATYGCARSATMKQSKQTSRKRGKCWIAYFRSAIAVKRQERQKRPAIGTYFVNYLLYSQLTLRDQWA